MCILAANVMFLYDMQFLNYHCVLLIFAGVFCLCFFVRIVKKLVCACCRQIFDQVVCELHDINGRLAEVVSLLHYRAFDVSVDECKSCPLGSYMVYANAKTIRT